MNKLSKRHKHRAVLQRQTEINIIRRMKKRLKHPAPETLEKNLHKVTPKRLSVQPDAIFR